jgi:hypothetical protein
VCKKPSYAGCGRHVEEVLGDVAPEDRCRCREEKKYAVQWTSLLGRLFGKA